jgi:hypothetical protein
MILLTTVTMNGLESWLPTWYYEDVFPLILIIAIIWTGALMKKEGTKNHLFFPFAGLIITAMLIFTSTHFIIGRYLLYLIPLLFLALALLAFTALKENRGMFQATMLCFGLMFYHLTNRADHQMSTLDNMHYVDQIHVLQKGIEYLETETEFSECIAGSFLIQQALIFPIHGYVTEDNKPDCVKGNVAPEAQYVMLISYEPDADLEWVKVDQNFTQVFAVTKGQFSAWVYKRIGG